MNRCTFILFLLTVTGCGSEPKDPPPTDTGARAAAVAFFEALGRKDWSAAYSVIDSKGLTPAEFSRRGATYSRKVGLDEVSVHIRACEERGDEATAHVVLTGKGHSRHSYRETVFLRQQDGAWRVVLPTNFGG